MRGYRPFVDETTQTRTDISSFRREARGYWSVCVQIQEYSMVVSSVVEIRSILRRLFGVRGKWEEIIRRSKHNKNTVKTADL